MFHCMNQQWKAQKLWHVQYIITSKEFNSEMLSFDNLNQNTDYVSEMCKLQDTPHSTIFLPNLATDLQCNMLQCSSVTRIQTKLEVHIIKMKTQVLKSYYIKRIKQTSCN